MSETKVAIRCSACGKWYGWEARFAGRRVKCPCGNVIDFRGSQPAGDDDLYGLAAAKESGDGAATKPVEALPAAVIGYRSAPRPGPDGKRGDLDVDKLKKQTAPLWLLGCGLGVESVITLVQVRSDPGAALARLVIGVGLGTVLMMAGLLIAAKVRTIDIGSLGSALLRMSAVAIVPMAVSDLLSPVAAFIPLLGGLALLIVDFMLYFALLGMFFDLDESDTWHCVGVIFVINVAVYFGLPVVLRFV